MTYFASRSSFQNKIERNSIIRIAHFMLWLTFLVNIVVTSMYWCFLFQHSLSTFKNNTEMVHAWAVHTVPFIVTSIDMFLSKVAYDPNHYGAGFTFSVWYAFVNMTVTYYYNEPVYHIMTWQYTYEVYVLVGMFVFGTVAFFSAAYATKHRAPKLKKE